MNVSKDFVHKGYVRKIESLGTLDGPGVRTVIFFSGCPLRCKYCHNPDTWFMNKKDYTTIDEMMEIIDRNKAYYGKRGGITISGGEPLTQPLFLLEVFRKAKQKGIHTALDTSGYGIPDFFEEILNVTDLVIFDLKETQADRYQNLTGVKIDAAADFLEKVQEKKVPLWIRTVIMPGVNDNEEFIDELAYIIANIKGVENVELLPYHTMGVSKYKEMNLQYPLENMESMSALKVEELNSLLERKIDLYKRETNNF